MTENYKKAVTVIVGACLFFLLERYCSISTAIGHVRITFGYPILTYISTVTGPLCGCVAGGIGQLLLQIGQDTKDWISVACIIVYCMAIGVSMRNVDVDGGFFERIEMFVYNRVQILAAFAVYVVLCPLLLHFLQRQVYIDVLKEGVWEDMGIVLSNLIMGTLYLAIHARSRINAANFYRD